MKPVIRTLGIVLSLSVAFSCHKSKDDATAASKLRISRIVQHDSSQAAGQRTVIDFKYDDQQRLDKFVFSSGDQSTGTLIVTAQDSFQYYYNGPERTFFKQSNTTPFGFGLGIQELYFNYNSAGQVIADSLMFTGNSSTQIREYSYTADKILLKRSTFYPSGNSQLTDTFLIKDNNLAEVHYGNPSAAYNTTRCIICTYDNKINPVNKLNFAACRPLDGILGFPSYLAPGISKNNIVAYSTGIINYQGKFMPDQTATLTYTYNSDGFPETCVMKDIQGTHTVNYYYEKP